MASSALILVGVVDVELGTSKIVKMEF